MVITVLAAFGGLALRETYRISLFDDGAPDDAADLLPQAARS